MGTLTGIAGLFIGSIYATKDYWNPPYMFTLSFPLEDFIYGFLFGGLCSGFYKFIFRMEISNMTFKRRYFSLVFFIFLAIASFVILVNWLKLNSIVAHITPLLIAGLIIAFLRRDLLIPSVLSSVLMTFFTFIWLTVIKIIYPNVFTEIWMLENLSGVSLLKIPIEELLFAFSLGFSAAAYYEFATGKGFRTVKLPWKY